MDGKWCFVVMMVVAVGQRKDWVRFLAEENLFNFYFLPGVRSYIFWWFFEWLNGGGRRFSPAFIYVWFVCFFPLIINSVLEFVRSFANGGGSTFSWCSHTHKFTLTDWIPGKKIISLKKRWRWWRWRKCFFFKLFILRLFFLFLSLISVNTWACIVLLFLPGCGDFNLNQNQIKTWTNIKMIVWSKYFQIFI